MIYLASPYTHILPEVEVERYRAAAALVAHLIHTKRKIVFSPVVYGHQLSTTFDIQGDFETWKKFNLSMLRRAEELWILRMHGTLESVGVREELRIAQTLFIPVHYVDELGNFVL